ncbi:MAG: glycosyltransferase family 4 protein [Pseudonocardiaceae bacterium]
MSTPAGRFYDDPPRIVMMVTSHITAGAFLPGLLQHFSLAGWNVTVISSPGEGLDRLSRLDGVHVLSLPMHRDPAVISDLKALIRLGRALRNIAPEVVLTATPKASLLGTVVARTSKVPLVIHLMWGLRSETLRGPRRALVLAFETVATRFSHRVIANSRSLAAELVRLRMVPPRRLTVLGAGSANGVDTSRFRSRLESASPGKETICSRLDGLGPGPVIGFVGRINPDKGVGVLLEAVEKLWLAGHSFRLLLVGVTEDSSLADRIADARARGRPVLLLQNEEDVLPLFQAMDIHCLPSLREGFPTVCLEASACGLPTVTTDATGAVDSVIPGITGLVVHKNDVESLAHGLRTLLVDHDMRIRLGAAAREWIEREFDAELVCRRHEQYLRQLYLQKVRRPARG